jgi:hypothetical protein
VDYETLCQIEETLETLAGMLVEGRFQGATSGKAGEARKAFFAKMWARTPRSKSTGKPKDKTRTASHVRAKNPSKWASRRDEYGKIFGYRQAPAKATRAYRKKGREAEWTATDPARRIRSKGGRRIKGKKQTWKKKRRG